MRERNTSILGDSDFLKFWTGESISQFGSQISVVSIPLTAVIVLQASPHQMGRLNALELLPYLIFTLFAGVWIDHHKKRTIMFWSNIGRFVLVGIVPALYILHVLDTDYLYVIVFLAGSLSVFFDLAYQSYIPVLIGNPDRIINANSQLQITTSLAQVSGPALSGFLISIFSAPFGAAH